MAENPPKARKFKPPRYAVVVDPVPVPLKDLDSNQRIHL
jgi:hypothetical protein